jgi:hypothetical protein
MITFAPAAIRHDRIVGVAKDYSVGVGVDGLFGFRNNQIFEIGSKCDADY